MKKITINQFKELISSMTIEEMEDIMPSMIGKYGLKYYIETFENNSWFKSRNYGCPSDYNISYFSYKTKEKLISERGNSFDDVYRKMLIGLLTNNYLSYRLITDE